MEQKITELTAISLEELPVYDGVAFSAFNSLVADIQGHMSAIKEFKSRDSDILIYAYPKSGCHWIVEIVAQLLDGKAEYSTLSKAKTMLEVLDFKKANLENLPSPRSLNAHLPFRMIPRRHIELNAKIIHLIRNPKDVAVSYFHHAQKDVDVGCLSLSWGEFLHEFMNENCRLPFGSWFTYEKDWETAKSQNPDWNVLTLQYENLKLNPKEEIKRTANFLGVSYTEHLIEEISEKVDFKNMAKGKLDTTGNVSIDKKPFIYRKGEIGDWKNWFTVADNEKFDQVYNRQMKESNLKFVYST